MSGIAVDSTGIPISSVSVKLARFSDTSDIVDLAITDNEGAFAISCQNKGKYVLSFSHLSYLKKQMTLDIAHDTSMTISLYQSDVKLKEISIKSKNTYFNDEKVVHIITKTDIQQSVNSLYMLEVFPQIEIDPLTQKITTKDNRKIKILINGISADQFQIQSIDKKNILKIEYYSTAPSRYRGYDSAVNIITKYKFRGISFSIFGSKSINKGYGYGNASVRYSKRNSLIGLYYNNNIGNYKNLIINEKLLYQFDSIRYFKEKSGIGSPNDFGHHNFGIKYIYHKKDKLDIVLSIMPNFYNSYSERNQNTSFFKNDILVENGFQKRLQNKTKKFSTLNFYINKRFKNNQELVFDLSYNYFNYIYSLQTSEVQSDSVPVFNSIYNSKNIKNSIISELFYTKSLKSYRINTDLKYTYSKINQITNSELSFPVMQNLLGFIELEGKHNRFYYKSNIGLSLYGFKNNKLNSYFNKISAQYSASIDYTLSQTDRISFKYNLHSNNPTLSQLNAYGYQLDEFLYRRGNPALKPYFIHDFALRYYYNKKDISIYSTLKYVFVPNKITEHYYDNLNEIVKSYSNINWEKYSAYTLNVNYFPFASKWLKFSIYLKIDYSNISFKDMAYSQFGHYFQPSLQIYYKKILFRYIYYSTRKYMGDNANYILPKHSYIVLGYQFKDFSISIDGYYPFSKAWRSIYETIPQSVVNSRREAIFYDNGKMFSLRFNYIFTKGKIIKPGKKKIENVDNDTGVLEEKEK